VDDEEENNSSPVKRPAGPMPGKKPPLVAASLFLFSFNSESFNCSVSILSFFYSHDGEIDYGY